MIRILHVLGGLDRGGAETMVMNLYRAIDKNQVQFDFITHTNRRQAYTEEIEKLGGKIYYFPKFKGINYFQLKNVWKKFFKEHPEYRIMHSHVRSYASLYLPIAKKAGLKTIIHSHSTSNGKGFGSVVKRIMQYPLRWQADYFFGCSKEAGAWLFGDKIVNSPKYHILQNAIDTEQYKFNPEIRKQYREELGLGDKKTFIHVGRFHPAKNHSFLLEVFDGIHKLDSNTVLLLAGDGPLRQSVEKQIVSLNLQNNVVLLGSRSDVPRLLQAADVFVFPSVWEGLPVTVVEAQAAGLPCFVSANITKEVHVSELVKYLPIGNGVDCWVNSINQVSIDKKNVIDQIKKAGFDIWSTASELTNFYKKLFDV